MALVTVEGVFKDGRVELLERPSGVGEAERVHVTFLGKPSEVEHSAEAENRARREAGERLLALLNEGIPFGGPPYPKREELYDRVDRISQGDR